MMFGRGTKKNRHRRDWRRLWRYCRCGFRWRCPDSVDPVPMPYAPTVPPLTGTAYRTARRGAATPTAQPDAPPSPARFRAVNRGPGLDAPTRSFQANGRPGALTPAQTARSRQRQQV
ncbi:hypothetical protein O7626_02580 [Micromonospora sp. WMMD1102]|uniref:hypothetical protein n=1 Tax=Micromonospora sp. WMMD1102 TaxID=3016105 RepID=UPI0024157109|nr:hypothetical protein [Micromonospora sp. WMMD1102]MDG4784828.1 hypothetical protein [Micromonospora sp. WMMD1102]